jgi:hypothetical protein
MGHGLVLHSHFCHALDAQAPMVLKMIERRVGLRMCHSLAICQHLRVELTLSIVEHITVKAQGMVRNACIRSIS